MYETELLYVVILRDRLCLYCDEINPRQLGSHGSKTLNPEQERVRLCAVTGRRAQLSDCNVSLSEPHFLFQTVEDKRYRGGSEPGQEPLHADLSPLHHNRK